MSSRGPLNEFINTLVQALEQIDKHFLTVHNHVLRKQFYLSQHLNAQQQIGNKGLKKSREESQVNHNYTFAALNKLKSNVLKYFPFSYECTRHHSLIYSNTSICYSLSTFPNQIN